MSVLCLLFVCQKISIKPIYKTHYHPRPVDNRIFLWSKLSYSKNDRLELSIPENDNNDSFLLENKVEKQWI